MSALVAFVLGGGIGLGVFVAGCGLAGRPLTSSRSATRWSLTPRLVGMVAGAVAGGLVV